MPVSDEVFKAAMGQLKDTELSAKSPEPVSTSAPEDKLRAEQGGSIGKSIVEAGKDLGSSFAKGVQGGDEFIKAMIYGVAGPLIPESGKAGEIAGKIMRPIDIGGAQDRAAHPKTMAGKLLGGAAEGVGGIATMPISGPGALARNVIVGMGMGEGSDIGKNVMGGLFGYFAGPQARKAGEETGQILGGAAGAQLNVTRVKAMGEAFGQVGGGLKNIVPAFKSAREKNAAAVAAGDQSNLWGIFADEFGSLRAQTRGIIADFTQRNIANAIRRDIRASSEAEQFVADAEKTGIYQRPWGLAERTLVPTLTETVASAKPESYSEAIDAQSRALKMQRSITFAYNKMVKSAGLPANKVGIEASAQAMRDMTQGKVDALSNEAGRVKESFRRLDVNQEASLGDTARGARDKLRDEAFARGSKMYTDAEALAGENRAIVSPAEVRTEGSQILKDFYSKVRPEEVPPVIRNMMRATDTAEGATKAGLVLPEEIAAERAAADEAKNQAGKPLTLKEANDLYKAFGEAAETARSSENHVAAQSARALQEKLRSSIEKSALPDAAKGAWNAAVENWRTDYAERFQQGMGKALGKERGGAFKGRESIPDEQVIDQALKGPTAFQEWETTFKGDARSDLVLRAGLEDRFRKQVMDKPFNADRFEESVAKFKEKYAPGLDKFPQVREKIDAKTADILGLENEKKLEMERYKAVMGGDVGQAIGPVQAKKFFESILADPLKMRQTLAIDGVSPKRLVKEIFQQANPFKNREYDPDGILTLVEAGKKLDGPSSMKTLLDAAFGREVGGKHLATLEAIARFTQRQALTDPRHLQATSMLVENPVEKTSGQKMASWISSFRAKIAGNTSGTYVAALGLSRFANAKVQAAVERAKHQALYDPETAQAILEMAGKDASQPLSMTTAKKIFGDIRDASGQLLIDKMIDKGFVEKNVSRGIIYGLQKIEQDREDPQNRETARRLRAQ
jgi:hypothetical protein